MNERFIESQVKRAIYKLKEGTSTSYYWQEGIKILPNRICFREGEMTKVSKSGRNNMHPVKGQFLANFTQKEESPLKKFKPYKVRTQIWQKEDYPHFLGYGTIGVSTPEGTRDTGDLLILFTPDECKTIEIYFFAAMGTPDGVQEAFKFLNKHIEH